MHQIEPHFSWREIYLATEDVRSPFYGYQNSEVYFTDSIYNHLIHPQWDFFGSPTLYIKQLYTDYEQGYTVLEFFGEWNDLINNDIMFLKRDVIEPIMDQGINQFILIGDNILNFHADEPYYYEEWFDEIEDGWISAINFRHHLLEEIKKYHLDNYLVFGGDLDELNWRTIGPQRLHALVNQIVSRRLAGLLKH